MSAELDDTPDLPEAAPIEVAASVAKEDELAKLHGTLARAILDRIKTGRASAAEWNAARAFLADNGINTSTGNSAEKDELQRQLAERRAKRAASTGIPAAALAAAAEAADRQLGTK